MGTYISLVNYTEQGIGNIKDAPGRLDAARELLQNLGGELTAMYLTMGSYDLVTVAELPSDEAAASFALQMGSKGNVRTTTLKAFNEDEFRGIIASLP
ncbi:MAG: GYD domain-containing protein [Alphaproteobacteria bacterium]|jgi:uncharacterized protein with GYD domain|nr:GYD domain-containing protein [Alphaproteobacteria bacterium]